RFGSPLGERFSVYADPSLVEGLPLMLAVAVSICRDSSVSITARRVTSRRLAVVRVFRRFILPVAAFAAEFFLAINNSVKNDAFLPSDPSAQHIHVLPRPARSAQTLDEKPSASTNCRDEPKQMRNNIELNARRR